MITVISAGVNQLHRTALNNVVQRLNTDTSVHISQTQIFILVGTKNVVGNILKAIFSKNYIILYYTGLGRLYTDFGIFGRLIFYLMIMLTSLRKKRKFIVENIEDRRLISRWTRREVDQINGSGFNEVLYRKKPHNPKTKKFISIGHMSRFGESKCTDAIMKIIATLPDDYKMIVAGEDIKGNKYSEQFYQLALSHDNIEMLGFLETPDEVSNFFQSIDLFLYPSVREGLPVTLLECIYFQVPFLTTNVAGCIDLAHYFDFPTSKPEDFGDQKNHLNLGDWGKYKPHWETVFEQFLAPKVEQQLEDILRTAILEIQAEASD